MVAGDSGRAMYGNTKIMGILRADAIRPYGWVRGWDI